MALKLKLKSGEDLVHSFWNPVKERDYLTINLFDQWIYLGHWQTRSAFVVKTKLGEIGFAFAGEYYDISFAHEYRDQIVFSVNKLNSN